MIHEECRRAYRVGQVDIHKRAQDPLEKQSRLGPNVPLSALYDVEAPDPMDNDRSR